MSFTAVGTLGPLILFVLAEYIQISELDFMLAKFIMPTGITWAYIVGLGLLGTLSQFFMTKAYGETKAGIVGAVSYTNIIFSILLGVLLGDQLPSISGILGIILIVSAGLIVSRSK